MQKQLTMTNHWGIYWLCVSSLVALAISNYQTLWAFYKHLSPQTQGALLIALVAGLTLGLVFAAIIGALTGLVDGGLSDAIILGEILLLMIGLIVGFVCWPFLGLVVGVTFFLAMNITYFPVVFMP